MSAATSPAGAKGTAETAELRNAEGRRGARNCGRTAEKVRKLSHSYVSDLAPAFDAAPALVLTHASEKSREKTPAAHHPFGSGATLTGAGPYTAQRYGFGRHWCVMHGADLVAVVAYRKGAAELLRRLNAACDLHSCP